MSKSSGRRTRRVFSSEFKAKVALAALRESCSSVSRNAVQVLLESVSKLPEYARKRSISDSIVITPILRDSFFSNAHRLVLNRHFPFDLIPNGSHSKKSMI